MRFWYDTEFYEDGKTIDLISFGIVAEDGRELYLENSTFDWKRVPNDHFVMEHVSPHMQGEGTVFPKTMIAWAVKEFIVDKSPYEKHELWGYYSSYDHVVLAQLFGTMVEMPKGIPWFTRDLKQWAEQLNYPHPFPGPEDEHHALNDARWNKKVWELLNEYDGGSYYA